jgi:hypothetical protein
MKSRTLKLIGACTLIASLVSISAMESAAHQGWTKKDCDKTRQKIARIESKMRQGYSASQGMKMEDELRRLRKLRARQCR